MTEKEKHNYFKLSYFIADAHSLFVHAFHIKRMMVYTLVIQHLVAQ